MDAAGWGLEDLSAVLTPEQLFSRDQVLTRPSPVPAEPGVYAWYFDEIPPGVPIDGCHSTGSGTLLYVGISPKPPPKNGASASSQNLRRRIRYHYAGNAAGSTLRLTLGSLLADELGISLRRVGSGRRMTFSSGESVLSNWMGAHARVCWIVAAEPWLLESQLIGQFTLPLNLDQNEQGAFHADLSAARAHQRSAAKSLPIISK